MTKEQVLEKAKDIANGFYNIELVYKKALPLTPLGREEHNQETTYRITSSICRLKVKNRQLGSSIEKARNNEPTSNTAPKGFHAPIDKAEWGLLYYSNKTNEPALILANTNYPSKDIYYLDGKEITRAEIEKLVSEKVLDTKALPHERPERFILYIDKIQAINNITKMSDAEIQSVFDNRVNLPNKPLGESIYDILNNLDNVDLFLIKAIINNILKEYKMYAASFDTKIDLPSITKIAKDKTGKDYTKYFIEHFKGLARNGLLFFDNNNSIVVDDMELMKLADKLNMVGKLDTQTNKNLKMCMQVIDKLRQEKYESLSLVNNKAMNESFDISEMPKNYVFYTVEIYNSDRLISSEDFDSLEEAQEYYNQVLNNEELANIYIRLMGIDKLGNEDIIDEFFYASENLNMADLVDESLIDSLNDIKSKEFKDNMKFNLKEAFEKENCCDDLCATIIHCIEEKMADNDCCDLTEVLTCDCIKDCDPEAVENCIYQLIDDGIITINGDNICKGECFGGNCENNSDELKEDITDRFCYRFRGLDKDGKHFEGITDETFKTEADANAALEAEVESLREMGWSDIEGKVGEYKDLHDEIESLKESFDKKALKAKKGRNYYELMQSLKEDTPVLKSMFDNVYVDDEEEESEEAKEAKAKAEAARLARKKRILKASRGNKTNTQILREWLYLHPEISSKIDIRPLDDYLKSKGLAIKK